MDGGTGVREHLKSNKDRLWKATNQCCETADKKGLLFPVIEDTRCPKLDTEVRQTLATEVKDSDANIAKLQTLSWMPWHR